MYGNTRPVPKPHNGKATSFIAVGDIHGDLNQLLHPLLLFLNHSDRLDYIIYIGDYINRGESTVYIYEIMNAIMKVPSLRDRIIFLRGNHESFPDGTRDYVHPCADIFDSVDYFGKVEEEGCNLVIESMMFDAFFDLDLDITFYDDTHDILFSHCSLTDYDLSTIAKFNERANRYNDSDTLEKMTYSTLDKTPLKTSGSKRFRNIHGHSHVPATINEMRSFVGPNHTIDRVCIDNDASYGFRVCHNVWNGVTEPITSHTSFLAISDIEDYQWEPESYTVEYGSTLDFNCMRMSTIVEKIKNDLVLDNEITKAVLEAIDNPSVINLDAAFEQYARRVRLEGLDPYDVRGNTITMTEKSLDADYRENRPVMYLNEVPIEFWERCYLEGAVCDDYMPVSQLFWTLMDKDRYGNNYELRYEQVLGIPPPNSRFAGGYVAKKLKGGSMSAVIDMIIRIMIGAAVVLIVIAVIVWCLRAARRNEHAMLIMKTVDVDDDYDDVT